MNYSVPVIGYARSKELSDLTEVQKALGVTLVAIERIYSSRDRV